jgi:predicted RNase H-like HicB family nuclease
MKYHFKIHRENGKFWAECLELEGCLTQADSLEELHEMTKDALNVYISEPEDSKRFAKLPDDSIKRSKTIAEVALDANVALSFLKRFKNREFFTTENTKHTEKRN